MQAFKIPLNVAGDEHFLIENRQPLYADANMLYTTLSLNRGQTYPDIMSRTSTAHTHVHTHIHPHLRAHTYACMLQAFKIPLNVAGDEYFLIENRQPLYADARMLYSSALHGGFAIYHVDEQKQTLR